MVNTKKGRLASKNQILLVLGIVLVALLLAIVSGYNIPILSNLVEAFENEDDIKEQLNVNKGVAVFAMFSVDWCPYCQKFKPDFKKLQDKFNGKKNSNGTLLKLVLVDCNKYEELCSSKYKISGYPTLKIITNNNPDGDDYTGSRQLDELELFLDEL